MRGYQALPLALVAGCLEPNPVFVEPQTSDGATGSGETTDSPTTSEEGGETTDTPDSDGSTGMPSGACGNGEPDPGEQCDDGNLADDDGCLPDCTQATCGDGKVWVGKEACDDGNDVSNDGCEPFMCVPTVKFVFVSSATVTGAIGGLEAAHDLCTLLALEAGLPEATYLAWLSDSKTSPGDFMMKSDYPYMKVNLEPVAMNWDKLTSEDLLSPIDRDEHGELSPMLANPCNMHGVHTNTSSVGAAVDPMTSCGDWTSATGYGILGDSTLTDPAWSYDCGYEFNCSYEARIYCFQQ